MPARATQQEFIEKAIAKHGNKYNYDKVVYSGVHIKIDIVCKTCGYILHIRPNAHLHGHGCKKCSRKICAKSLTLTQESFIQQSKAIYGDNFDYAKVKYINCYTDITLICNRCNNDFITVPNRHLHKKKKGEQYHCAKCNIELRAINVTHNHKTYIEKIGKDHVNYGKFEYLSEYCGTHKNITVKCLVCGNIFEQRAGEHLKYGCKYCGRVQASKSNTINVSEFEELARKIHEDKYVYCQDYVGGKYKIKIWCKVHKEYFMQNAGSHIHMKCGCPKCKAYSRGETKICNFLDLHNIVYEYDKALPGCKYQRQLNFDFFLPKPYNMCIEFDGPHHFRVVKYNTKVTDLEDIQKRDQIKNTYCEENGIKLLRIPYWELNNIEKILSEELKIMG